MPDLDDLLHERLAAVTPTSIADLEAVRRTSSRRRVRRRAALAGATAAVASIAGTVVLNAGGGEGPVVADDPVLSTAPTAPTAPTTRTPASTADRSGPLGSSAFMSCVERYSPSAVTGRGFAFDGIVTAIGPSVSDGGGYASVGGLAGVTFDVQRWFAGGSGSSVTVDLPEPGSAGEDTRDPLYGVGTRILVSGESLARHSSGPLDHPAAWSCGFTRYWDPQTAADWDQAFAG